MKRSAENTIDTGTSKKIDLMQSEQEHHQGSTVSTNSTAGPNFDAHIEKSSSNESSLNSGSSAVPVAGHPQQGVSTLPDITEMSGFSKLPASSGVEDPSHSMPGFAKSSSFLESGTSLEETSKGSNAETLDSKKSSSANNVGILGGTVITLPRSSVSKANSEKDGTTTAKPVGSGRGSNTGNSYSIGMANTDTSTLNLSNKSSKFNSLSDDSVAEAGKSSGSALDVPIKTDVSQAGNAEKYVPSLYAAAGGGQGNSAGKVGMGKKDAARKKAQMSNQAPVGNGQANQVGQSPSFSQVPTIPSQASQQPSIPLQQLQQYQMQQQQNFQQQQQQQAADAIQMAMFTMRPSPLSGTIGSGDGSGNANARVVGAIPGLQGSAGFLPRQLGVEDALAYLDKVKRQFHDRLEVYNQFLEIMKNFKSHNIDTPGVISHVCELFKGHDNLILGFNTFLPPGFKIELPNRDIGPTVGGRPVVTKNLTLQQQQELMKRQVQQHQQNLQQQQQQQQRKSGGRGRGGLGGRGGLKSFQLGGGGRGGPLLGGMGLDVAGFNTTPAQNMMDDAAQASNQGQPVEFDHAIKYVTKIKKRFSSETDTYKTFLDILHSYQNEQRSIKEVLEQVSTLFKDHADLLKEFTYFLPDAVRESAKTELVKHAAKAQKASRMRAKAKKSGVPILDPYHEVGRVPQLERNLLGRIKAALGTRELWGEFLKCLDLFAQELISRSELLALISDIFGERADLLEEFDRLLASRGATDDPVESAWFSMPLTDIDFGNCRRCTPSYRALPAAYPKAPCSERTAMCRSVLNDTWVSVPEGSEDSGSKSNRRNQFQEALFKCEDDRYEVDVIIDSNKAAIRALEPLAREIEALSLSNGQAAKFRYRLEKRSLSVIHLKAIARIYGDHGTEVLELLRRNPAGAIPVILKRLKEKDQEWCRDRHELNKGWKDVMERNYSKSLDHRSFHFKQTEKRSFTQKVLLQDIREKKSNAASVNSRASNKLDEDHVMLNFDDPSVHRDIWGLIALKTEKSGCEKSESDRIAAFLAYFCHPFFKLPESWLSSGTSLLSNITTNHLVEDPSDPKTREDAFPDGCKVRTPYSMGVVEGYDVETGMYQIKYPYGTGYLRSNIVKLYEEIDSPIATLANQVELSDLDAVNSSTAEFPKEKPTCVYTTVSVYVFMRQYHLLCERLKKAKELCIRDPMPRRVKHVIDMAHDKDIATAAGVLKSKDVNSMQIDEGDTTTQQFGESAGQARYTQLLSLIYANVAGSLEPQRYEEELKDLVGPDVFFMSTVDKLVTAIHKQLSVIANDTKGAESLAAARQYCDPATENPVTALAALYQNTLSHLELTDGTIVRLRFSRGVLRTETEKEKAKNDPGVLPLPKDTIITPKTKFVSDWKSPPRLGISLVEQIPILQCFPGDLVPNKIPILFPLDVDFGSNLELSGRLSLSDEQELPTSLASNAATVLTLPIYKEARVPISPHVASVIRDAMPPTSSDDITMSDKRNSSSAWFSRVLNGSVTNGQSENGNSPIDASNNEGKDTEMTDA